MEKIYAGAKIRSLRRNLGITQSTLAKEVKLSHSYINQLENDQRPLTTSALLSLSTCLGVTPDYFLPDTNARLMSSVRDAMSQTGFPCDQEEIQEFTDRFPHIAEALSLLSAKADHGNNRMLAEANPTRHVFDNVRDFFYWHRNHIPELDTLAEELANRLGGLQFRTMRLAELLDTTAHVRVIFRNQDQQSRRVYDWDTRTVSLRADLTDAQQCFELAMQWAFLCLTEQLDALTESERLPSPEAKALGRIGLAQYFAAAVVMPYGQIVKAAEECRYDLSVLSQRFGTGFEMTCHRLSTLQRPGAEGVPLFFVRTDRAGNISKRQSASSFHFSRSGGSCPLWIVNRAFETPNRIIRQVSQMPDGRTYLWIARTVERPQGGFHDPNITFAIGLGCDISQAHRLVYSDGLNLSDDSATRIGAGCRVCERTDCKQRAFPATGFALDINENMSQEVPYATK